MNVAGKSLRIIFAGTPEFSAQHLQYLIAAGCDIISTYTQPDRPKGRGKKVQASPVKLAAIQHNIPVYQPLSLRNEAAQAALFAQKPDLMVVVAYGLLLPAEILAIPRFGCINVHASLLPRWRGAAPIQRAILAGDEQTGVTIMQMDEGLDTGPMLAKQEITLADDETSTSLHDRLIEIGCPSLLETIHAITSQRADPAKQDNEAATYAAKLSSAEAEIDWSASAVTIDRQIRAFNPVPGAWTIHRGERVKVWSALPLESVSENSVSGRVAQVTDSGIDVETTKGAIRLTEIQPAGKTRMSVEDFLRGNPSLFAVGDSLGSVGD